MKKSAKTLLKAALGLVIAGAILVMIGIGMGAQWSDIRQGRWAISRQDAVVWHEDSHVSEEELAAMETGSEETVDAAKVKSLKLDVSGAAVYIRSWEEDYISVQTNGKLSHYSVELHEDGTCEVETEHEHWTRNQSGALIIYVPEGKVFENVKLDLGAGAAEIVGISAKKVSADVGAGALDFEGEILQDGEFDCGAGETIILLNGHAGDYDYELSCDVGEVEINGDNSISGIGGEQKIDNGTGRRIRLDCGVGRIELNTAEN